MNIQNFRSDHKFILIISLLLIFIFINKHEIFRNFYNIINKDHQLRMEKIYGFCENESWGFVNYIKKKYSFKKKPTVINYNILPNSYWMIHDPNLKSKSDKFIILNYKKNLIMNFKKNQNNFINKNFIQNSVGIKSITIISKDKLRLNNNLEIYKISDNKRISIFSKKINESFLEEDEILIDFDSKLLNSRWERIFVNIDNLSKDQRDKILSLKLNLKNKFNVENLDIIEKFNNCYYIK